MADNVEVDAGSGGATLAADDIGGILFPRNKLIIGADGTNDGDVSSANPMPVKGTGTAGTANSGVVTIQGIASMTAVQVADNGSTLSIDDGGGNISIDDGGNTITVDGTVGITGTVAVTDNGGSLTVDGSVSISSLPASTNTIEVVGDVAQDAAVSGNPILIGGRASAASPSDMSTDGDAVYLWTTLKGALNIADGGSSITVDGAVTVTNAGTFVTQENGAALTALQLIDDAIFADDAAFTIATSKVMVAGGVVDETSTDTADEHDAAHLRVTTLRQLVVTNKPTATGEGCDTFSSIDLDESEEEIKASAGQLYGYSFANLHASSVRYLRFYNATAANTTVGSTAALFVVPIPPAATGHIMFPVPVKFDTALCAAATTGVAANDTGAPGANEVVLAAWYK